MTIGGVSGGNSYTPKSAGASDTAQLQQQKKTIEQEINRVSSDNTLQAEAKEKKLDTLERQLEKIEASIQKASASANETSQAATTATEKIELSVVEEQEVKGLQNKDTIEKNMQTQLRKSQLGEVGNLLDDYA